MEDFEERNSIINSVHVWNSLVEAVPTDRFARGLSFELLYLREGRDRIRMALAQTIQTQS